MYLQGAEQVTHFCRLLHQHQPLPDSMGDDQLPPVKPLSDSQKLRKVILELLDTERCYVKVSNHYKCILRIINILCRYIRAILKPEFRQGNNY